MIFELLLKKKIWILWLWPQILFITVYFIFYLLLDILIVKQILSWHFNTYELIK